jgi:hypothetical protein
MLKRMQLMVLFIQGNISMIYVQIVRGIYVESLGFPILGFKTKFFIINILKYYKCLFFKDYTFQMTCTQPKIFAKGLVKLNQGKIYMIWISVAQKSYSLSFHWLAKVIDKKANKPVSAIWV